MYWATLKEVRRNCHITVYIQLWCVRRFEMKKTTRFLLDSDKLEHVWLCGNTLGAWVQFLEGHGNGSKPGVSSPSMGPTLGLSRRSLHTKTPTLSCEEELRRRGCWWRGSISKTYKVFKGEAFWKLLKINEEAVNERQHLRYQTRVSLIDV